jgi:membrane-associated phospholipid phosphatase
MLITTLSTIEHGWGLALILWFQSWRTPLVANAALIFHFLGSAAFYIPLVLAIYWSLDKYLGRRLILFMMLVSWVNSGFKSALRRPRPYNISPAVRNVVTEASYGIPSGHAQNATVVGGLAANELRRWWMLGAGVAYAILTGISRMILGVHYPQDVIVGITFGLIALAAYAVIEPRLAGWVGERSLTSQIILIVVVTLILMALHPGLIPVTSPEWLPESLPVAELLDTPLIPIGAFLGAGIGLALEPRFVDFDSASGSWERRTLRFLLGWVGIMALYLALRIAIKGTLPEVAARLVRFGLIGFWATYGAPWLFVRTGLAARTAKPDPYTEPAPEPTG